MSSKNVRGYSVVPVEPYFLNGWRGAREDEETAAVGFIAIETPSRHPGSIRKLALFDAHQLDMLRPLGIRKEGDTQPLTADYEFVWGGVDDDRRAGRDVRTLLSQRSRSFGSCLILDPQQIAADLDSSPGVSGPA